MTAATLDRALVERLVRQALNGRLNGQANGKLQIHHMKIGQGE